MREVGELLTEMLKERDAKLERAGDPHRFLKDLDRFLKDLDHSQAWQPKTESDIANTDFPASWAVAEKLLSTLHQMWENRQTLLSQSLNLQMFNRDDKQTEVLLSLQGHALSKEENPSNLEQEKNVLVQNNTIRFYLFFFKGKRR